MHHGRNNRSQTENNVFGIVTMTRKMREKNHGKSVRRAFVQLGYFHQRGRQREMSCNVKLKETKSKGEVNTDVHRRMKSDAGSTYGILFFF